MKPLHAELNTNYGNFIRVFVAAIEWLGMFPIK